MKKTFSFSRERIFFTLLTLFFGLSAQYVFSAWGEPVSSPAQSTLGAPVHSGAFQEKIGSLVLNTAGSSSSLGLEVKRGYAWLGSAPLPFPLGFGVEGKVGAEKYCTPDGGSCITTQRLLSDLAGGGGGLPTGSVFMFEGACPSGWASLSASGGPYYLRMPLGHGALFPEVGVQGGNAGFHNHTTPGLGNGVRFDRGGGYPIQLVGNGSMAYTYVGPPQVNLRFCSSP